MGRGDLSPAPSQRHLRLSWALVARKEPRPRRPAASSARPRCPNPPPVGPRTARWLLVTALLSPAPPPVSHTPQARAGSPAPRGMQSPAAPGLPGRLEPPPRPPAPGRATAPRAGRGPLRVPPRARGDAAEAAALARGPGGGGPAACERAAPPAAAPSAGGGGGKEGAARPPGAASSQPATLPPSGGRRCPHLRARPDFLRTAAAAAAPRARGYLFISGPRALIMEPLSAEPSAAAAAAAVPPLFFPGRSLLCGRAAGMDLSLRISC